MKDYKINFKLDDKEYSIVFNLNVMEAIQEEYGTVQEWGALTDGKSGEVNAKALKFGFMAMMNEAIEIENEENGTNKQLFTLSQVGRIITRAGIEKSAETLNNAVIEATKEVHRKFLDFYYFVWWSWIRRKLYPRTSVRWRFDAWCMVYGNGLCNNANHKEWSVGVRCGSWTFDRIVPNFWCVCGRSFLCDYFQ